MWAYIIFTGLVIIITMVMIRQKNITIKKKHVKEKVLSQKVVKDTLSISFQACLGMIKRTINNEKISNDEYKDIVCNTLEGIGNAYKQSDDPSDVFAGEVISHTKPFVGDFMENTIFAEKSVKEK